MKGGNKHGQDGPFISEGRLTCFLMSSLETMMTLGGSPIAVAVPPMLEKTTSAMSTGRGSRFNT